MVDSPGHTEMPAKGRAERWHCVCQNLAKNRLPVTGGLDLACSAGSQRGIRHDVERGRSWQNMESREHDLQQVWVGMGSFAEHVRAWRSRRGRVSSGKAGGRRSCSLGKYGPADLG